MRAEQFERLYADGPPWEIDRPQPAIAALIADGTLRGRVLDIGCGTGHNARLLAHSGCSVTAFDFAASAIAEAERLAGRPVYSVHDALDMASLGGPFDSALDSGTFHTLGDSQRPAYLAGLQAVLVPGATFALLAFRTDEPGDIGPRRLSEPELRELFGASWQIIRLEPIRYALADRPGWQFTPGGAHAWLMVAHFMGSSHERHPAPLK